MLRESSKSDGDIPVTVVADNRRAHHDYHIIEVIEAGIALQGTEVKSLRLGRVNLREGYAAVEQGEVFLYNVHISPYEEGNRFNHEPLRRRRLLLHRREILRLSGLTRQQGMTLVPMRVYFKRGRAKLELALARGKKLYDKREDLARKDAQREIERALRGKE